jgi:hypothetical protein
VNFRKITKISRKFFEINHFDLSVDEPDAPGTPKVVDWDKDHVDLEWTKPRKDGGSPITGYVIQKKEKGSPVWQNAAQVPGDCLKVSSFTSLIKIQTVQKRISHFHCLGLSLYRLGITCFY